MSFWKRLFGDSKANISQIGMSYVIISKDHILSCNYELLLKFINEVCIPQIKSGNSTYSTIILSINGYDHDPRSLWNIPEVVLWFKTLHNQMPYTPFFLSPGSVQLYFAINQPYAKDKDDAQRVLSSLLSTTADAFENLLLKIKGIDKSNIRETLSIAKSRTGLAVENLLKGIEEKI